MAKKQTIYAYLRWLAPDTFDVLVYSTVIILTFVLSNWSGVQDIFRGAEIKQSVLDNISNNLGRFLPHDLAANLAVFVFWALIGLIVYLLIIIVANFTSDLKEDLSVDKYIYPVGMDKYGRFKHFILVNIERIFGTIVLIIYLDLMLNELMPQWADTYRKVVEQWPISQELGLKLILSVITEFLILHGLIILLRLVILRRRVLGL